MLSSATLAVAAEEPRLAATAMGFAHDHLG
jgi:hypothetical protein